MSKKSFLDCHDAWHSRAVDLVRDMPPNTVRTWHDASGGGEPSVLFAVATGVVATAIRDFVAALIEHGSAEAVYAARIQEVVDNP